MVASPTGLGPKNDCAGEGQQQLITTDPSSRQRDRPTSTTAQLSDSNKNLVVNPRRLFYSSRNIRLRLSSLERVKRVWYYGRDDYSDGIIL
jgi:hypothetical protein